MPVIRIELASDRERARSFHDRVRRGGQYPQERELVLDEAWSRVYTPTGEVHYRGRTNGQPPSLKSCILRATARSRSSAIAASFHFGSVRTEVSRIRWAM